MSEIEPRYKTVVNEITRRISDGEYREGEALPSERDLALSFGISRETMRKSIKTLENNGYLISRPRRGTFVTLNAFREVERKAEGLTDVAQRLGQERGQTILFAGFVDSSLGVANSLGINTGEKVFRLHRIRTLGGTIFGIQDSYIAIDNVHRIDAEKIEQGGSLYRYLQNEFDIQFANAEETVTATACTNEQARYLRVRAGDPLLKIERVTISEDLRPIEFCSMYYTQSHIYRTVVKRRSK